MDRPPRNRAPALLIFALLPAASLSGAVTDYTLDLKQSRSGWLKITLETTCEQAACDFQMPIWNATYQVRDFAQYVKDFHASDNQGRALSVEKQNPSLWRVATDAGSRVVVSYRVLADRPGPFGAYADGEHVCLNLPQVLLYPVAGRHRPFSLRFENHPKNWETILTLDRKGDHYQAADYDRLVDTPVHLSESEETQFLHAGRPIRVIAYPLGGDFNLKLLKQTARRVVAAAAEMMDDKSFSGYTFVYHFSDINGGGMEYRDGASIWGPARCGECTMASLTAHEFFHRWNVKRIRPRSLEPIDFSRPNRTPSLWFVEGVTSAYSQYIQLRAGLTGEPEFLARLPRLINEYERRPASQRQSAEEAGIDAWLEVYPAYGRADRSVSYYLRGELIAYLLDLSLRRATANRRSFDDVMRRLNRDYGRPGRPFEDLDAIVRVINEVAGRDMSGEVRTLVQSSEPVNWDRYLGYAGYQLETVERRRVRAGLTLADPPGQGVMVSSVEPGGAAEQAGVRRGDRIFRLGRRRVTGGETEVMRAFSRQSAEAISVGILRDGKSLERALKPRAVVRREYTLVEVDPLDDAQRRIRRGFLERRTEASREPALISH